MDPISIAIVAGIGVFLGHICTKQRMKRKNKYEQFDKLASSTTEVEKNLQDMADRSGRHNED